MTATHDTTTNRPRILTGDRPTGRLHLGHYVGTLANRVALQHYYETFLIVADLHLLTTRPERAETEQIGARAREIVLDQLAAGIDPEQAVFYLQSGVPEVCVLNTCGVPKLRSTARNVPICRRNRINAPHTRNLSFTGLSTTGDSKFSADFDEVERERARAGAHATRGSPAQPRAATGAAETAASKDDR